MNDKERQYVEAQDKVLIAVLEISLVDVDALIAAIDRADSIGPMVDPTLWMKGADAIRAMGRLMVAAIELKKVVEANRKHLAGATLAALGRKAVADAEAEAGEA